MGGASGTWGYDDSFKNRDGSKSQPKYDEEGNPKVENTILGPIPTNPKDFVYGSDPKSEAQPSEYFPSLVPDYSKWVPDFSKLFTSVGEGAKKLLFWVGIAMVVIIIFLLLSLFLVKRVENAATN